MDVLKHLLQMARDWTSFPFVLAGNFLYLIAEFISGRKLSRRGDMAIAGHEVSMNRAQRRARGRR
jgi:hypothetical protein